MTKAEGKKILGPSMIIRRQTATIWTLWPTNKSNEVGKKLLFIQSHENGTAQSWS